MVGDIVDIIKTHPQIEQILNIWGEHVGETYDGYRGHVYRMFNPVTVRR